MFALRLALLACVCAALAAGCSRLPFSGEREVETVVVAGAPLPAPRPAPVIGLDEALFAGEGPRSNAGRALAARPAPVSDQMGVALLGAPGAGDTVLRPSEGLSAGPLTVAELSPAARAPVAAPAPQAPVSSASSIMFAVHLASYRQAAHAEAGWSEIITRHGEVLTGLQPRLERVDLGAEKGVYQRLKAGPLPNRAAARAACAALTDAGAYCAPTSFAGRDLGTF